MRLGNDIVDIAASTGHNPRFIDRIVSPAEKAYFEESQLWQYWAAKEAAYKAIKQTRDIPFHHREFIVAADFSTVRYHEDILHLRVTTEPTFAVVTDGSLQDCQSRIHSFPVEPKPDEQSLKARELLLDLAAEHLQLPRLELSMEAVNRIPRILHGKQRLNHAASLTHHGRFVAASIGFAPL